MKKLTEEDIFCEMEPLTPEQEELKERVKKAKLAWRDATWAFERIKDECEKKGHVFRKTKHDALWCRICHRDGGWWCPNSPDHKCDYEHPVPGTNHTRYDEDDCRYCHQPKERK